MMWGLTRAVFSFLNNLRVFASTTRLPMILSHYIWTSFDDHFGSRRLRLSGHFSQRGMPTCSELDDIVERSFLFCLCFFLAMENYTLSRPVLCLRWERASLRTMMASTLSLPTRRRRCGSSRGQAKRKKGKRLEHGRWQSWWRRICNPRGLATIGRSPTSGRLPRRQAPSL